MYLRLSRILALLVVLLLVTACGGNGDANESGEEDIEVLPDGLSVRDAWIRPAVLPEGSPTPDPEHADHEDARTGVISAMYLVIENNGSQAVQLVAVETTIARVAELHETQDENGLMRMRPVEMVDVPADGEVTFEPGGLHIMLVDINQQLEAGDVVPVTLVFNTGERLELPDVPVQQS